MSGISLPYLVTPSTAEGMPIIPPNAVLGNVGSSNDFPTAISTTSLTALINPVSSALSGAMPPISGVSTAYYGGDGAFHPVPATPLVPANAGNAPILCVLSSFTHPFNYAYQLTSLTSAGGPVTSYVSGQTFIFSNTTTWSSATSLTISVDGLAARTAATTIGGTDWTGVFKLVAGMGYTVMVSTGALLTFF